MDISPESEILGVNGRRIVDAVRHVTTGDVYSIVEYDLNHHHPLWVHDDTRAMYEHDEQMAAHFARIHNYVNLDLTEIKLFTEELLPVADDVRYISTSMDVMTFVRVYLEYDTGVFLALESGEPVEPVVAAIDSAVDG